MLNKTLIKRNFKKGLTTYDDNAIIQQKMAQQLCNLIPFKKCNNILEIGSYTGLLTKEIVNKIDFQQYLAVDLVNSYDYIKNLSDKIKFINCDIEKFDTKEKFDLIIANASLQWCNDFIGTINKLRNLLTKNGYLIISTFASDNFTEIKKSFGISLDYLNENEIKDIFKDAQIMNEKNVLQFNSSIELLKHLKLTGVNSVKNSQFTYKELKNNLLTLEKTFNNKLTYSSVYIIETNH